MIKQSIKASGAFFDKFNGRPNLMTPEQLQYYESENFYVELASGKFMDVKLYGVTVLEKNTLEHRHDLSKPFDTLQAAEDYIHALETAIPEGQGAADQ